MSCQLHSKSPAGAAEFVVDPAAQNQGPKLNTYWMLLAAAENTLFALPPIKRMAPMTITKITASITAYSAMS